MRRRPPRSTRTDTLCPDTTIFRYNAGTVLVQDFLHPLLHAFLDFATSRTDGVIQGHSRDDRSHGGFRHFPDSLLGIDELKLVQCRIPDIPAHRSEEHTSELQSLMRISYADFCLKKNNNNKRQ